HRPKDKPQTQRYSRHYYDVYKMLDSETGTNALNDLTLLENVVTFKKRFYPSGWANYDAAMPKTIKLIPPKEAIDVLKADYASMKEMIFGEYPDFDTIIESLRKFEKRLNIL
ncbi:MAG: nucleotidyl transferase AbiEii/AbiGii toxin family protein, partial [Thermodesulfobacteriota bacterium]